MWKGCKSSPSTVQQRWLGLRRGRTWGPQATKSCPWRRRGSWRCPSDPSARRSCCPSPPLGSATSAARCGSRTGGCSAPRQPEPRKSPRTWRQFYKHSSWLHKAVIFIWLMSFTDYQLNVHWYMIYLRNGYLTDLWNHIFLLWSIK